MFEFIHEIIEAWILQDTSEELGGFKMGLLQNHLRQCVRCRSFALDVVEFSHSLEAAKNIPKLASADREEIHARVMAAFERERLEERMAPRFERAAGPLVRRSFLQALAMVLLVLGALFVLSIPFLQNTGASNSNVSATVSNNERVVNALQFQPKPLPTSSAELSGSPSQAPTKIP
jgi:hypothetical protein